MFFERAVLSEEFILSYCAIPLEANSLVSQIWPSLFKAKHLDPNTLFCNFQKTSHMYVSLHASSIVVSVSDTHFNSGYKHSFQNLFSNPRSNMKIKLKVKYENQI